MVKPEWGTKRICPSCNARFYDLQKDPVACPMCGSTFSLEELLKVKKTRTTKSDAKKATAKKSVTPKLDDEDEDIIADTGDDVLLDEDDDLANFGDDDTLLDEDDNDTELEGFQVDPEEEEEN